MKRSWSIPFLGRDCSPNVLTEFPYAPVVPSLPAGQTASKGCRITLASLLALALTASAADTPFISEFIAKNTTGITDEDSAR